MSIDAFGRGCNRVTGSFTVIDVARDADLEITRLAVDFEQHCEGRAPALRGSIRYKVPTPPPSPGATLTNHAPAISLFAPVVPAGPAPLTTAFRIGVADEDSDALTCGLDLDDDGSFEVPVPGCQFDTMRSASFTTTGTHTVTLRVSDGTAPPVTAQTNVVVRDPGEDPYGITVRYSGSMTWSRRRTFADAAARWARVIRGGLSDQSLSLVADECVDGAASFSGMVDDVLIDASIAPIDGPGGVLGSAGPCVVRFDGGLTVYGVMQFDAADVPALEASGAFAPVVLHEMGHVLGFGTLWRSSLVSGVGTSDPVFAGSVALGAWQALGGSGPVPVENTGGLGTADAHWRESVFGSELMTGYLDDATAPLSALTIASLADLGYQVDLGAADPYLLPMATPLAGLRMLTPRSAPARLIVHPIRPHRSV
jgi:hypothetical protein